MSDKIYIKLTHNQDKQPGDNRPVFVAPINPKSPPGKTWRLGVKIEDKWYNQAGFLKHMDDEGNGSPATGIINNSRLIHLQIQVHLLPSFFLADNR